MGLDFGQSAPPRSERTSAAEIPWGAEVAEKFTDSFCTTESIREPSNEVTS